MTGTAGRTIRSASASTTYCATGGGDAKKLRAAGVPAVECAVGSDTAHAVDEHVSIDALERTAEWSRRLPDRLVESIESLR